MGTPSHDETPGLFDRFAAWTAYQVSQAPFFMFCVLLVVVWLPTYPLIGDFAVWSLWINNPSSIITFLLVALLQNTTARADKASQQKQNATADALADLFDWLAVEFGADQLSAQANELRAAVGLEERVSS